MTNRDQFRDVYRLNVPISSFVESRDEPFCEHEYAQIAGLYLI
jgi:hypothetical protein